MVRDVLPVSANKTRWTGPGRTPRLQKLAITMGAAAASVAVTTLVGLVLEQAVAPRTILLLYLAPVIVSAIAAGSGAAVLASVLGFLVYDFVFIEPRWTFAVAASDDFVALAAFVAVALVTGALTARRSEEADRAGARASAVQGLLDFSSRLAAAPDIDGTLQVLATQVATAFGTSAIVLIDREGTLDIAASEPPISVLAAEDRAAAIAARDGRTRAGASTSIHAGATFTFLPVIAGRRLVAVLGLRIATPMEPETETVLLALVDQAALAIDRATRARDGVETALLREGEKLQAALLSSLSHDFRTPLASITGAATSLRQLGDKMDAATRDDLLASIEEDAGRLNRFLGNLLDMTRIESGRLRVRQEGLDVREVVERAKERVVAIYPGFAVEISVAPDLPGAAGDPVLLEQAMFNLLDNAHKYSGSDQPVTVFINGQEGGVTIAVTDQGKGIARPNLERVFDKFYRQASGDGGPGGTGLGLTIARSFVVAMGGTISVESPARNRRGARFIIRLAQVGRR